MDIMLAYNNWAQTYDTDTNLTRDLDAHITRNVLGDLPVRTMLEIGCGTGVKIRSGWPSRRKW